ncbi:hemin uptake protein HemP [Alcanivorax sp. JB21]|uniref:hemin uptake protein HemP n=1 Tax=Alcanivorax limicola TaxID=2874102 RepID=UPI001CBABF2E|nr:hemin uptake protein HemP [Alcanivorax limicola]MBZ2189186.1 hemin uptake protein HemP [Alcanivorax limicola]
MSKPQPSAAHDSLQATPQTAKSTARAVSSSSRQVARQVAVHNDLVPSDALLGSDGLLWIEHDNSRYQLRRTASGKLILTK